MKKILLICAVAFMAAKAFSQPSVTEAKTLSATEKLRLKNAIITDITNDSALATNSQFKIATEYAVRQYVANHSGKLDSAAVEYMIDSLAGCGATVNIRDFGALGDGITDDLNAIQAAHVFVSENGGGTVFYPACEPGKFYRVSRPYYIYSNTDVLGEGEPSRVKNDRATKTIFGDQICFYSGNYGPASYDQTVKYGVQNISAGQTWIKLSDAAKIDSFTVGQVVLVESVKGVAGAGGWKRPEIARLNIMTGKNGDTIFTKYPNDAIVGALVGNVGHFADMGSEGATDGLGHVSYIAKNVSIKNMNFESVGNSVSVRWGIIDFVLDGIRTKGLQGIFGNGFAHGKITNVSSQFAQKGIELSMYSHDILLKTVELNWFKGDTSEVNRPVIRFAEKITRMDFSDIIINAGQSKGGPIVIVQDAKNNRLSNVTATADSMGVAAIDFRSTSDTSATEGNIIENCNFLINGSINYIRFTMPSGLLSSTLKNNIVRNCRFDGILIGAENFVQFSGDSNMVIGCRPQFGGIAAEVGAAGLNNNMVINCYIPKNPYTKVAGVEQIDCYNATGALFTKFQDLTNVSAGYQSYVAPGAGSNDNASFGKGALQNIGTADYNSAFGALSLNSNTSADGNTANGYASLFSNTTGNYNTASGYHSSYGNTTGSNTSDGYKSLFFNATGNHNTAAGREALYGSSGGLAISNNTAVGQRALFSIIGDHNTAVGSNAGLNYLGSNSNYFGYNVAINHIIGNNVHVFGSNISAPAWNSENLFDFGGAMVLTNISATDSTAAPNVRCGIGVMAPESVLELRAGSAGVAGMIFNSQTPFTGTVAAGKIALSFDGTDLFGRMGTTNYKLTQQAVNLTAITTSGSAPSIAAGTGAGTGPTISISGNDVAGKITLTTGTTPTLAGTICTVTFSVALGATPKSVIITAASSAAAQSAINRVFIDAATLSTTILELKNIGTALTASASYIWYYLIVQ